MKRGRIFLVGPTEGVLTAMEETYFAKEDFLQELLAVYPDLLPGDQISPEAPRRWLLVAREMGVPEPGGLGDRWSLDHLYLDQDGIPTFVECKRATDTRIRREVVAQMLDYAANGLKHWSMDLLRRAASETAQRRGKTIDTAVQILIGDQPNSDIESFWQRVEANLRNGKVRLLFVADSIPAELRRLVEFLNEKMDDVEVLAVEIKQFLGGGEQKVLVPRLIGMTETAREKKPIAATKTSRGAFLDSCPLEAAPIFDQVLRSAEERGYLIYWGKVGFSIRPTIGGALTSVLYGWPPAAPPTRIEFYTGYLKLAADKVQALRDEVRDLGIFKLSGEHTLPCCDYGGDGPAHRAGHPRRFALIGRLLADGERE
jgi:hypothetical protein